MIIYEKLVILFNLVRHNILYKSTDCFGVYSIACSPCWNYLPFSLSCQRCTGERIFKVAD